jgi:hypothetical protein
MARNCASIFETVVTSFRATLVPKEIADFQFATLDDFQLCLNDIQNGVRLSLLWNCDPFLSLLSRLRAGHPVYFKALWIY